MIISASRRTDIPAHYSAWLLNRMREGFVLTRNPMNRRQVSRVDLSPSAVDCIVFWSKNPRPMLDALDAFRDYPYYFQYTLNAYGREIEPGLPGLAERIGTFKRLSDAIGPERVVWRYDPILLSERHSPAWHVDQFGGIAGQLGGHTGKVVISFIDFYAKITKRMEILGVISPSAELKQALAGDLSAIARAHGLVVESCAEDIDLSACGIAHGRCIDDRLIERLTTRALRVKKDPNQRLACGCVQSVDIGAYDCCPNGCVYCYANASANLARRNAQTHDPSSPFLTGGPEDQDIIRDRKI